MDVENIQSVDLERRQPKNGETVPLFGMSTNGRGPFRRREQLEALLRQSPQYQPDTSAYKES